MRYPAGSYRGIPLRFAILASAVMTLPFPLEAQRMGCSTQTTLTAPSSSAMCGQTVTFEASLHFKGGPCDGLINTNLSGLEIHFDAQAPPPDPRNHSPIRPFTLGLFTLTGITSHGHATASFIVGDHTRAAAYPVRVTFKGYVECSGLYLDGVCYDPLASVGLDGSAATSTFLVTKAPTRISISDFGAGAPGISIDLLREHDQRKISGNVAVKVNGTFLKTVSEPLTRIAPSGAGPWTIECQFAGDDSYLASSASKTVHR